MKLRKYPLIFTCLLFALVSCTSNKPEPAAPLRIEVKFSGDDMASIYVYYNSDKWAFINGVELKNAAGDLRRYNFKDVRRNVLSRGSVFEAAVYTTFNINDPNMKPHPYVDELRAFIGGAEITARPLAEHSIFYFVPVEIINN